MIRRIRQTEAEAVTDLWDEAAAGVLEERGRRNIAAMLVLAAVHPRAACFVDDGLNGFVVAEIDEGLLPGRAGRVEELYARGDAELERALVEAAVEWLFGHGVGVIRSDVALDEPGAELLQELGFEPEATRFGLYRESSTSNCTSSP
jgi:hypothetical protein